ncbi:MAG: type II secretion system F family protein [Candidatus Omnitrophica bacterium]|nr:type II secretion system F family protein [Candidatus Omnitrophota bacterium]
MSGVFVYKARDKKGNLIKGNFQAESQNEAIDKLHKMDYLVIDLRAKGVAGININDWFNRFSSISQTEKLIFYIQFANLIHSGLPILGTLTTLAGQITNKRFKAVLENIARQIESGSSLSKALDNQGRVFPKLLVHMVKAGETSGKLSDVLARFSQFAESDFELRSKVKSALFYPALLTVASAALIIFITSFVVPNFITIFQKANINLPLSTRILNNVGISIRSHWLLFLIAIFILIFVLKWIINTKKGRIYFDGLKLKLPLLGSIFRRLSISRFSRTLATMEASGVPILKSLEVSKEVMGNVVISRTIEASMRLVEEGAMLSESLKMSGHFPADVLQMISAGEQSGNIAEMCFKLSDYYERLIDYHLRRLISFIEPLFLLIIGGIVAFIMASMLMPVFDMVKVIRALKH